MPPLLLNEIAKVSVRNISFAVFVQVLENVGHLVKLVFDPQVVEPLLKLAKAHPVVKIYVKESVSICQRFETL